MRWRVRKKPTTLSLSPTGLVQSRASLINKYPLFFRYLDFGIECYDGWLWLLDELIGKIVCIDPLASASQIKEKYGTLRVYMMSTTDEIEDLIEEYEVLSETVCELCGSPGKINDDGWISVRCDTCRKNN